MRLSLSLPSLLLSLSLLLLFLSTPISLHSQRGHLLAHKRLDSSHSGLYAVGEPLNVSISLYNIGDGSAYSVHIQDDWPKEFDVTHGALSAEFEEIESGSVVYHNFTLVPQRDGSLQAFSARLSYQQIVDGPTQYAISSPSYNFTVYPDHMYQRYIRSYTMEWSIMYGGLAVAVIIPFLMYMNIYANYEGGLPKVKKD